jgi:hypothetical protein
MVEGKIIENNENTSDNPLPIVAEVEVKKSYTVESILFVNNTIISENIFSLQPQLFCIIFSIKKKFILNKYY